MYILKNALKNIGRNKGRNSIVIGILLIIVFAITIAISINVTTKQIIDNYKNRFGSEITFELDYTQLSEANTYSEKDVKITNEQYESFADSDCLKETRMKFSLIVKPKGMHSLWESNDDSSVNVNGAVLDGDKKNPSQNTDVPNAKIVATSDDSIQREFDKGARKIKSGKLNKKADCLISEDYAKLNELKIGDKIEIPSLEKKEGMTDMLTVAGIYLDYTMKASTDPMFQSSLMHRGNEIVVSTETMKAMKIFENEGLIEATFVLKNPSLLDKFTKEVHQKGLSEVYKVYTDVQSYQKIVAPVEGLNKVMNTFVILVLSLGSIILLFITSLAIRERKYEIGVLRAIGMKKSRILIGFICEMVLITGVCLVVGLSVGQKSAQPVCDYLLSEQVDILKDEKESQRYGREQLVISSGDDLTKEEPLTSLTITLSLEAIYQIVLIAIFLALLSSIAGIVYVTRYEPMQILSERN